MLRHPTTAKGFTEQLQTHKSSIEQVKAKLEGLHVKVNGVKDADLSPDDKEMISQLCNELELVVTAYVGAIKPIQMSVEPRL